MSSCMECDDDDVKYVAADDENDDGDGIMITLCGVWRFHSVFWWKLVFLYIYEAVFSTFLSGTKLSINTASYSRRM